MALNLKRPVRPTSFPLERPKLGNVMIATGFTHTVGLKNDGTCVAVGDNSQGQCNVSNWTNVVKVVNAKSRPGYGYAFTVGLKEDGTVVTTRAAHASKVAKWTDIVDIGAGYDFIFGLKSDGTCVLSEGDTWGYSVSDVQKDTNVIAINALWLTAITISIDGTIHASSWDSFTKHNANAIKAGSGNSGYTYLTADGELEVNSSLKRFSDIVDFDAFDGVIGLKQDGTCVAYNLSYDVSDWKDIISVSAAWDNYAGVKSDGTCVATGNNSYRQCNVSEWNLYTCKKALMISLAGLNFTNYNAVNSISVSGVEPENTKRRLAFKVGDKWNKLAISSGKATLSALPTQTITADSVLKEGNTVAEVASATSIPDFAGKIVYPAIALYADSKASVMPTLGLKANATTTAEKYTQEEYSQEYHLSDVPVSIVSLKADITAKGAASAAVTVSLKNGDNWGDYIDLEKAIGQKATDIKFRTIYTVTKTDGSESASLNNVTCTYTTSGNKVTNKAADVVTVTKEFTNDLVYIHAYVKHKPLKDAKINVYAALRPTPQKRDMMQIGTGSGEVQTVKVDDVGINQDTLRLYYDGKAVYDFDYNTETSEITFKAAVGVVVSASYEYGWKAADWLPMTQGLTQNNDSGNDTTEYTYQVPEHSDALTVTAIRYELLRPTGHVSDSVIGIGTGTRQIIKLPHIAKKESIVCSGAWSYDYDSRLVTVVADKDTEIKISYDWIAEQPEVISIGAGWADE